MNFTPTPLAGAWLVDPERHRDERGWFARTFCQREFEERGLETRLVQCSASFNGQLATLRGLHYQAPPFAEAKLVRCTRGAIFDVIVDLRPAAQSFGRWYGTELTAENGRALYIPKGFAHGFLTLADETEVFYQMSEFFSADQARGVRWDDPLFGVKWPAEPRVMSRRDREYPSAAAERFEELRGL